MKRLIFATLLLIAFFTTAKAQYFPVDTARLNKAYRTLKKGERTAQTEQEFLEAFPTTWLEWTMTYCYVWDNNYDISMSQMLCEHIEQLFGLPHINDTILCKKIINLAVGMKDTGECSGIFQEYLVNYIFSNEDLVLSYLSKLKKGHQMEFWQFCWSTVTECNREEHFNELYNRNKNKYPKEMEISRVAFQYFYNGINYPTLLPHKNEEYQRKSGYNNYKKNFNGYIHYGGE